jgi:hypothetical protein
MTTSTGLSADHSHALAKIKKADTAPAFTANAHNNLSKVKPELRDLRKVNVRITSATSFCVRMKTDSLSV